MPSGRHHVDEAYCCYTVSANEGVIFPCVSDNHVAVTCHNLIHKAHVRLLPWYQFCSPHRVLQSNPVT